VNAAAVTYQPLCVVCGQHAQCDQSWVEGTVVQVERHVHTRKQGDVVGARIHLDTADGLCLLDLGERYGYLAEGAAGTAGGLALRAYHLRRARSASPRSTGKRPIAAHFLTGAESLVVLEPDWLLDVTALSGTDYCLRQWLANRLASQPATLPQLRGTAVHACFQSLCRDGILPADLVPTVLARADLSLALLGASPESLLEAVAPHLERLTQWRARYGDELLADGAVPCFESTLLCPELGLRGRIDLVLRRAAEQGPSTCGVGPLGARTSCPPGAQWDGGEQEARGPARPDGDERDARGPRIMRSLVTRVVELKTGKYNEQWPDPEFQVRGYYAILVAQQRLAPGFRAQVIYTGGAQAVCRDVPCGPEHIDHVLNRRNQAVLALLAGHAPQSKAINRCRMSAGRAQCVQLSALLGLDHCQGRDLHDAAAGEVDPQDAGFYATHYRLLRLESRATSRALAGLWRLDRAAREEAGTAITLGEEIGRSIDAGGRQHYRFSCRNTSELRVGETVLLSDGDPVRGEVTVGTLTEAGAEVVAIAVLEPIARPALVDRYDSGEAQDRTVRALHAWLRAPRALRALMYMERGPEFRAPNGCTRVEAAFVQDLNQRQTTALDLALRARDYLLIQGPPGTGKTFLIARIAQALVARGERVLVAAWTNQAVDTILHTLVAQGFDDFARLGSARSMDQAFLPYAVAPEPGPAPVETSAGAIAQRLRCTPVLAGTVSSFADSRLSAALVQRDVVILDEAAQLSIAASVGVLRLATRFILVGDDQQLPAVVQSEEATREGLSLSPFAALRPEAQAHGAFVRLAEQYRMHQAIAAWPSEAFYGDELAADPSVGQRTLPGVDEAPCDRISDRDTPIVLVDAGAMAACEVETAAHAVLSLVRSGVPAREVGVVAPFRATVSAVRRLLEGAPEAEGCTVDTVDRFQGGQREAMVVCLGLSGLWRRGHAFVDDPRRLNVAFTRARAKLVVVGDLSRAATLPTLAGFLQHCLDRGMPVLRQHELQMNQPGYCGRRGGQVE